VVQEQDLINNFDLLKTYLWVVGHTTPLPHLLHHEASWGGGHCQQLKPELNQFATQSI
jgi:hypothetical protein